MRYLLILCAVLAGCAEKEAEETNERFVMCFVSALTPMEDGRAKLTVEFVSNRSLSEKSWVIEKTPKDEWLIYTPSGCRVIPGFGQETTPSVEFTDKADEIPTTPKTVIPKKERKEPEIIYQSDGCRECGGPCQGHEFGEGTISYGETTIYKLGKPDDE